MTDFCDIIYFINEMAHSTCDMHAPTIYYSSIFFFSAYDGHSIFIALEYMAHRSMKDILKCVGRISEPVVGFCAGTSAKEPYLSSKKPYLAT